MARFTVAASIYDSLPSASIYIPWDAPTAVNTGLDPAFAVDTDGQTILIRPDAWYIVRLALRLSVTDGAVAPGIQLGGDWAMNPTDQPLLGAGPNGNAFDYTLFDSLPASWGGGRGPNGEVGIFLRAVGLTGGDGGVTDVQGSVLVTTLAAPS